MHNVVVDYVSSRVEPALPTDISMKISEALRYRSDGYQHTYYFKTKKWDGFNYLFNMATQIFRTGLLWRVEHVLKNNKVDYKIIDLRKEQEKISHLQKIKLDINPFEFQHAAAQSTIQSTHGVIASPTGTGKSLIMALLTSQYYTRTLIIENSRVLLDQIYEFFDSILPGRVGIVGSGDFELNDVVIATYQSLSTILGIGKKQEVSPKAPTLIDWLNNVGLVISDEVHEADTDSMTGICANIKTTKFVGMTATPYMWAQASEKGKNLPMEQNFGIKVYDSRETVDFVKLGLTVPLTICRPLAPQAQLFSGYRPGDDSLGEYLNIVKTQVVENEDRIKFIADKVKSLVRDRLSCYVYYNRIAYGERLCEELCDLDPIMLQGNTPRDTRNRIFKDMENKKQLLVVSDIGSYGLNIKSLNSLVLAWPVRDARQLKGRTCRASPGKTHGLVIDPVDWAPFLAHHAKIRLSQYKNDNDNVIG